MAFCSNCGNELKTKVNYCPKCGNKINKTLKKTKEDEVDEKVKKSVEKIMDTPDSSKEFDKKDISENLAMGILCYLGVLALIPYFACKDSKFVKYHSVQGINLLIIWGIYTVLSNMLGLIKISRVAFSINGQNAIEHVTPLWISFPVGVIGVGLAALSVIGIVYVCQGKAKELPIINKFKIVK